MFGRSLALVAVVLERDWARVRAAMVYLAALAVAQLATLARYPGTVEWADSGAWIYVAGCVALLALAVFGAVSSHTASRRTPVRSDSESRRSRRLRRHQRYRGPS